MQPLDVEFLETAIADLQSLYIYLRDQGASAKAATRYVDQLQAACERIGDAPKGARTRNDLAPGLRLWPHRRRAVIAYRIDRHAVLIVNIFPHGRDVAAYYASNPEA